jgi:hypothetical protein
MFVPSATPRMVNPGVYYAELDGDVVEKESKFGEGKVYFQAPLLLTPKAGGVPVRYLWSFQQDSDVWTDALLALGGRRDAAGGVTPPAHVEGRRFEVVLVKAVRKDGKEKREIVSAAPVDGVAQPTEDQPADDGPDPLDQAKHSDDDVPF